MAAYCAERANAGVGMIITGGIYLNREAGRGSKLSTPAEAEQHRLIIGAVPAADPGRAAAREACAAHGREFAPRPPLSACRPAMAGCTQTDSPSPL